MHTREDLDRMEAEVAAVRNEVMVRESLERALARAKAVLEGNPNPYVERRALQDAAFVERELGRKRLAPEPETRSADYSALSTIELQECRWRMLEQAREIANDPQAENADTRVAQLLSDAEALTPIIEQRKAAERARLEGFHASPTH